MRKEYKAMNADADVRKKKRADAAKKAAETKGAPERSRESKMANWTRRHGKNDAENPYSKQNYSE